ncbi:E3 ubiquitin-protein ligase TRIM9-like [Limulus polyphemus]|uniref:E3 ubiquitin-protein ligase TRIM9-like n=1 Tax=Limulus polyphemus TaxID=6850 RepID=A0ABM1B7D4_LIMPO|nr:E3 ubiquitin-protein ligase TRIM9-like [Limulus polyphemus]XP_022243604.1 E3 ubiquitin-protein ligase TRIM9-like [Limulus polyphemus]
MEEELKCPACKHLFKNPVLLPCCHSLCLNCALQNQQQAQHLQPPSDDSDSTADYPDGDKLSLVSETDSGVVCNSRPSSYVGTPNLLFPPLQSSSLSLGCPVCQKVVYFDEHGANNLQKNKTLQNIVDKYGESKQLPIHCQLCEDEPKEATVMCEQCEVFYCDICRDGCHPARGPLAAHSLVSPQQGKAFLRSKNKEKKTNCGEHPSETLGMYCMLCKVAVCGVCLKNDRHANHDVQALVGMCKAQKTELSQNLQALSEKAKGATEFIQKLKGMVDKVPDNCVQFENSISAHCDYLIEAIHRRKLQLLEFVHQERDSKIKTLREQIAACASKLQQTTGLLQFCIEALKETDATAFLQVGPSLVDRVAHMDMTWHKEVTFTPRISEEIDLTLDHLSVLQSIELLTFAQLKAPGPPVLIPEECTAENNTITVAWQPHPSSFVEYYQLELAEVNKGDFKEVYCGSDTICRIETLLFNTFYNVRVRAVNNIGQSDFCEAVSIRTDEVAWFSLDPVTAHPDIILSNENQTVTCDSYEHRVVLGSLGFSQGVHYWEFTVDKYNTNADAGFGVATLDVAKDMMLGKDDKGWSMYIDYQRSWFLHSDRHDNRTDGGVGSGSVVGVLLDLDQHQLSFYVNDERQGPIAFTELHQGMLYPAVSVNRNVQVTVQTGLDPPTDSSDHESEGEGKGVG